MQNLRRKMAASKGRAAFHVAILLSPVRATCSRLESTLSWFSIWMFVLETEALIVQTCNLDLRLNKVVENSPLVLSLSSHKWRYLFNISLELATVYRVMKTMTQRSWSTSATCGFWLKVLLHRVSISVFDRCNLQQPSSRLSPKSNTRETPQLLMARSQVHQRFL